MSAKYAVHFTHIPLYQLSGFHHIPDNDRQHHVRLNIFRGETMEDLLPQLNIGSGIQST